MKIKAVIYTRVSSRDQEESGYSLDAQQKLLEEYASKKGFEVLKVFRITESASGKQIRIIFSEMLDYVKRHNIENILCEKIDRLTRNLKDAAIINEWVQSSGDYSVHFVKENFIVNRNTRAHENLIWDMKVAIARFYTNNLSEEVRKGLNEKASQGMYPGSFKYGYLSEGEKGRKRFVKDQETHLAVKKLLESYASGQYSMKALLKMATDSGIRTRYGKKLYKSQIERLLVDTFNYGWFTWKGKLMKGDHEPLITKETYDQIQEIRIRKKAPFYLRKEFLFSKMITCGECDGSITSEIQKGHVYCHCNHYKDCGQKKYTREEVIESGLVNVMDVFARLNKTDIEQIREKIRANHADEIAYKESVINSLNSQYKAAQVKIDRLYDDKLAGVISDEFWAGKHKVLIDEQRALTTQLERLKTQETEYFEVGLNILELASRAKEIYSKRTPVEKRMLLKYLFKHISLKDGKVEYELKTPVRKLYEKLTLDENTFEPQKAFTDKAKASSGSKINTLLRRLDSNQRPIA